MIDAHTTIIINEQPTVFLSFANKLQFQCVVVVSFFNYRDPTTRTIEVNIPWHVRLDILFKYLTIAK